jgi:hypothetical protein
MRPLGLLLLAPALLLAACGSDTAADSVGAAQSSGTVDPPYDQVAMLTVTEGGGQVTDEITWIDTERALQRYVDGFPSEQLQREVLAAAQHADLPEGERLGAAVVYLGCTPPTDAVVTGSGDDLRITATGKPSADIQCLAPITTVAVVGVSAS